MRTCDIIMAAALACCCALAHAQQDTIVGDKVITNVKMIGLGATNILDTYLSPEKYKGTEVRYISHTTREPQHSRWSTEIVHQGDLAYADNRAGEGGEMAGMYNFMYAWHYNWALLGGRLSLKAGAAVDANIGFIYNTRNGNNPAQARAYVNITPSAAATYRFSVKNRPFALRYELWAPLCGLMFSPNYGQSYYEIFSRGNYDHNLVPTTFVCSPSLRQMLTLDFSIRRTTLRIGYLADIQQAHVNNLKSHIYTHALVIGVVKRFKLIKIHP